MAGDLDVFLSRVDIALSVFAVLSHLAQGAAGAWGFPTAAQVFLYDQQQGVYIGIQAVYFSVFGVIAFLAELRLKKLQDGLLKRLSLLNTYAGRGFFSMYLGSTFLFLPWDPIRPWINRVVGGLQIASGVLIVVFAFFAPGGVGGADGKQGGVGANIKWGEPDAGELQRKNASEDEQERDTVALPMTATPLSPASSGPIMNPFLVATSMGQPRMASSSL